MTIWRLYTGPDGASHADEVEFAFPVSQDRITVSMALEPRSARLTRHLTTYDRDFHNAPEVKLILTIAGVADYVLGDGRIITAEPGDAVIVEDTDGGGHALRVKNAPRVTLSFSMPSWAAVVRSLPN
jgi:hypothetical protein